MNTRRRIARDQEETNEPDPNDVADCIRACLAKYSPENRLGLLALLGDIIDENSSGNGNGNDYGAFKISPKRVSGDRRVAQDSRFTNTTFSRWPELRRITVR